MKIGLVGAPGSGKTTLGAMLYTEFLTAGFEGAYLVHEYAKEWLARGNGFDEFMDQYVVSQHQLEREARVDETTFSPVICDSCVWLGGLYAKLRPLERTPTVQEYLDKVEANTYDVTIFVPLPDKEDHLTQYRVHDNAQALHIQKLILEELKTKTNVIDAPKLFKDRVKFIKDLRKGI